MSERTAWYEVGPWVVIPPDTEITLGGVTIPADGLSWDWLRDPDPRPTAPPYQIETIVLTFDSPGGSWADFVGALESARLRPLLRARWVTSLRGESCDLSRDHGKTRVGFVSRKASGWVAIVETVPRVGVDVGTFRHRRGAKRAVTWALSGSRLGKDGHYRRRRGPWHDWPSQAKRIAYLDKTGMVPL